MPIHDPTPVRYGTSVIRRQEIDQRLAATAAEYVGEERAAATEEAQDATASAVFSVRLSPATHEAVLVGEERVHPANRIQAHPRR